MTVVVDVGCMPQGREESVGRLIDAYDPPLLLGFDPHPDLVEGVGCVGDTVVVRRRAACWTHGLGVNLLVDGIKTGVPGRPDEPRAVEWTRVESVDLVGLLRALPLEQVVLKLDCEGAEYPLLRAVRTAGLDERLRLVLVEWHPVETAHGHKASVPALRCPVEDW